MWKGKIEAQIKLICTPADGNDDVNEIIRTTVLSVKGSEKYLDDIIAILMGNGTSTMPIGDDTARICAALLVLSMASNTAIEMRQQLQQPHTAYRMMAVACCSARAMRVLASVVSPLCFSMVVPAVKQQLCSHILNTIALINNKRRVKRCK